MPNNFDSTFRYKLIYVFRINDSNHKGMFKVGEATLHTDKLYPNFAPNCHDLNYAAKQRINSYTTTAGIVYDLVYTEIAVYNEKQKDGTYKIKAFNDHKVHDVLRRSGIKNHYFDTEAKQNEWFVTDLQTIINAIKAVKNNQKALPGHSISKNVNPIVFRPEQRKAINETVQQFALGNHMLWNAKMRFGKTLCALQVVKEVGFRKTIIITHRPAVDDGWFDDFKKIFYESDTKYNYGSKNNGLSIDNLINSGKPFVYFASIQDLRGSIEVGGKYPKNDEVFNVDWDLVVTDEAHEGTQTELGKKVRERLIKENTKDLSLSGTPFNLFDLYSNDNTYTWDYIMEQEAKYSWMKNPRLLGDHNPYEELPKLNIFTYHLEKLLSNLDFEEIEDKAFNFKEFFRTWTGQKDKDFAPIPKGANIGDFVHENAVKAFLDLLCSKNTDTNYPFSTDTYRDFFRHTLWMVPGVKEAKALSALLKKHIVFGSGAFKIVNVAGNGDDEYAEEQKALDKLRKAVGKHPENTYTITISCGRLTTGVTVPEWTGVLMLAGSYVTDAKQYLQTIFRVQTPANINGKIKENCYVFDFAPDRTLRVIYDAMKKSSIRRVPKIELEVLMGQFLNFCPVISLDVSQMIEFKAEQLLQEIKSAYIDRVLDSGFDDMKLYNNEELIHLTDVDIEKFNSLQQIIGKTGQTKKARDVKVSENNLTDEERAELERLKKERKKEKTEEEKKLEEERRKILEQKSSAISILRGISIRIPLMVYGLNKDIGFDVSIDDFADLVDEESWKEFMPTGVTKVLFKEFVKYYDKDIFIGTCRKIRSISKDADDLEPTDRVKRLIALFNKFKNPDKETVLTPWNVVNLHMSETIGGFDFFDDIHKKDEMLDEPRFVDKSPYTKSIFHKDCKLLEINSKTGLYPLYLVFTLYRLNLNDVPLEKQTFEKKYEIWDKVVNDNLFVVCKTEMAKMITRRTLVGYRYAKINAHAFDDLIMQLKDKPDKLIGKLKKPSFWNKGGNIEMKFDAVVGNPPYQGINHSQIYPFFYLSSIALGEHVSLIFPVGWQEPKNANNLAKLNTRDVKTDSQIVFIDNRQNVFPGISGAEWTNIILWKKGYNNNLNGAQLVYTNGSDPKEVELLWEAAQKPKPEEIIRLAQIVSEHESFASMDAITSVLKPYGLRTDVIANSDAENYKKYHIGPLQKEKQNDDDIKIYAKSGILLWVPKDYQFPKTTKSFKKYKVFVPYAWGNMSEKTGLGGAFSDIVIGSPFEACTETYLESGCFDDLETAKKHAKYLFTKFCRALLYLNKNSQHSTTSWGAIPIQDYKESWWNKSIAEIDEELFKKYNIPNDIKKFVRDNIQPRFEANIVNFNNE